jgi:hypothetical protein
MLTCLKTPNASTEARRQSQGPGESKNSCKTEPIAASGLKRSGFVVHSLQTLSTRCDKQNEVQLFFDVCKDGVKGPLLD